ncbi:MAG: molybdate ABC transporter substrate-binding protein [Burkholderiaceae bacterium]|nr:molybdate ABC transporter substrate-binding protein [Burkholderiaceae bacterium]
MTWTRLLPALAALCFVPAHAETVSVAVAASAQYVFEDLRAEFKKETGNDLSGSINSSGKFATQIMSGAPYDVFLSADMEFPEKLAQAGYTTAAPRVFAFGALVVWSMKDIDLHSWQAPFADPGLGKVALANPQTAPYGREAMKVLAAAKLETTLQGKLVYGESIAQTNQYIFSGVADVGFTAKSIVLSPEMKGKGKWIEVPRDLYSPIAQGAVLLKHGADNKAARQFYDFLYSDRARAIFERYGYLLP